MQPPHDDHPHVPGPSLWPVGFAIGVVVLLVGLIVSWYIAVVGAILALVFGFLWVRDLAAGTALTQAEEVAPETSAAPRVDDAGLPPEDPAERYPRNKFLEFSTIGLGAVIGGIVAAPALGFMVAPAFLKQGEKDIDIGPLSDYPEGKFIVTTFTSVPRQGVVSRRTAFVRYNGPLNGLPSFTIISNHCAHLGCPVLGDTVYGGGDGRLHLLARALELYLLPPVSAVAPVPDHMRAALERCGMT